MRLDMNGRTVTYTSKTDLVAAVVRELILTGELPPGTPLKQRELSDRFGVSATPVREALGRLQSEGLISCDTHRGSTVAEAGQGAQTENFQIRAALESLGAELAAVRIGTDELAALVDLNEEMGRLAPEDGEFRKLNRRLHFGIYECAHSPLLLTLLRLLWHSMPDGPVTSRPHDESTRQHRDILEALRRRDPAGAAAATRSHILGALAPSAAAGLGDGAAH
jgi:DNA-binding GntR family transcriptional regulator